MTSKPTIPATAVERFWSNVDRAAGEGACWPWTGGLHPLGYGRFKIGRTQFPAHRIALSIATGDLPAPDTHACHSCDNRRCCNPAHLRWGSRLDNMRDAVSRGRLKAQRTTHCPAGHPYQGDNLYIAPNGARCCRECRRQANRVARSKRHAA